MFLVMGSKKDNSQLLKDNYQWMERRKCTQWKRTSSSDPKLCQCNNQLQAENKGKNEKVLGAVIQSALLNEYMLLRNKMKEIKANTLVPDIPPNTDRVQSAG